MIFHWIILWRAEAINYHFKEVSPQHTSYVNGVSFVGSPFPLCPSLPKHSCQYRSAATAGCNLHLHCEGNKSFSPPTPTVLLRGCDVAMGNSQNTHLKSVARHTLKAALSWITSLFCKWGQNVMTRTKERLKGQEQKPFWGVCLFVYQSTPSKIRGLTDILEANLRW